VRIEYHPAIDGELREIRDFYESRSVGLGKDFVDAFDAQMSKIAAMPERWMIARGDTRRAIMNRFPYVICFRILPGGVIRVTVVKHERRHPSFRSDRL
jgi:toxin ParE1/3/4